MVHIKEFAVLATFVALAQCQPSFQEERGLYARGVAPNYKAEFLAAEKNLGKDNKALKADGTTIKKVEAQDKSREKSIWGDDYKLRKDGVRINKLDKDMAKGTKESKERLKKDREERLRMERKKKDAKQPAKKLAARNPYGYSSGVYEREAYPHPYQYAGLQERDIYERNAYEQAIRERDLDLYERELYAREAYPEPEPEPEFDEYNHLAARDLQLRSILERDPDSLTERDIEILASSLSERDLHEILAREAEPDHDLYARDLYARDAEAEAEAYENELYAREAEAYQNEMHAREAEAEAEHEIYAREAEAEDNLNFERDMPVVDMVKRMLGYQKDRE